MCWEWDHDVTGKGPYTFAFAYLAAYGRMMMRSIREQLPDRTCVSQDTDGLWVLESGVSALHDLLGGGMGLPGELRRVAICRNARWYTPKHYYTDGEWTLAGFHAPVISDDGLTVEDTLTSSLWSGGLKGSPSEIMTHVRRSAMPQDVCDGVAQPDGWVTPRRIIQAVSE
jgi:hypothetical protein